MKIISLLLLVVSFSIPALAEWKIDFSKRQKQINDIEKRRSISSKSPQSFLDMVFERQAPQQEIVIMHNDNGFSPQTLQIKKNQRYKVHVVNVSERTKNVSFMMDAFSQHHGTFLQSQ